MIDDNIVMSVIGVMLAPILFGMGFVAGWQTMDDGVFTEGRNQGIIFCTEKPKECAVEYQYIKLKETQK
jgi:hypothetical protein